MINNDRFHVSNNSIYSNSSWFSYHFKLLPVKNIKYTPTIYLNTQNNFNDMTENIQYVNFLYIKTLCQHNT